MAEAKDRPLELQTERRAAPRYAADARALCRAAGPRDGIAWPARIRDIAAEGISILVDHELTPGTLLILEVPGGASPLCVLRVRVVHTRREADGTWLAGCALAARLSEAELERVRQK
jgi:hypothetical protein